MLPSAESFVDPNLPRSRSSSSGDQSSSASRRAALSQATAGFRGGQERDSFEEPRTGATGGGISRESQLPPSSDPTNSTFSQLTGSQSTQPSRSNYFGSPSSFHLRTPSPPREADDYLAEIRTQLNKETAEERAKSQAKIAALPPIPEGFSPEVFHAILDHLRATDLLRQGSSPTSAGQLPPADDYIHNLWDPADFPLRQSIFYVPPGEPDLTEAERLERRMHFSAPTRPDFPGTLTRDNLYTFTRKWIDYRGKLGQDNLTLAFSEDLLLQLALRNNFEGGGKHTPYTFCGETGNYLLAHVA